MTQTYDTILGSRRVRVAAVGRGDVISAVENLQVDTGPAQIRERTADARVILLHVAD
ncbi:hypothetical protein M3E18_02735 [Kocuria sp. p3-SID1433]|uniref:hypothetical protein n=1 Tax=unclassified Kocuria TaxID=2649579 RepID=UPI0021A37688|nr:MULTISPECIES: hypothetical protein [unclassified Kocuria]MCT1601633.1 hypothetical protein [Kocuria sp. p3-SID1428]MCT2179462.1 hypothetical protein [Kocuria sp. p3-SID1433]